VARPAKKPAPKKSAKAAPAKKAIPAAKSAAKSGSKAAPAKAAVSKAAAPAKTAAPAKAAATAVAAPPARKPRKPSLSPDELTQIRSELGAQKEMFERELAELEAGTFNQSQSDLSGEVSFDEESADAGTFTFERERDLSLGNNLRDLLDKVRSALRRLDAGTYGSCERCGKPIDKARLKALPYSVLCIDCKKLEERVR
jgi:RNA polymerase-binding transcription factor